MAAMMISASTMRAPESGTLCETSVVSSSWMNTAPTTVPRIRTWPPESAPPPTTTAVMAVSSISSPV